jgi:tRNA-specific 2-thiouridylase
MPPAPQPTVMVGLSGGVDSSVAAALLLRAGYRVVGGFMKNWSDAEAEACGEGCGWERERQDALRVAAHLGIPLQTLDFEREYRERVVAYMVAEYAAGRTPNPDVLCNSLIKFDLFLAAAREAGAELVATGHYARRHDNDGGSASLLAGVDANKDQSYFLHRLSQAQLRHALFPVGHLTKPEVRALARELGLPTADKKDSQGLCFVGKVDMKAFLAARVPQTSGPIVDVDGRRVGEHQGLAPYTVGQRHGFGHITGAPNDVSEASRSQRGAAERSIGKGAYFVVRKEPSTNTLVVAPSDQPQWLLSSMCVVEDAHWIAGTAPALPWRGHVRIRYRQPLQEIEVAAGAEPGTLELSFAQPQRAVTPGQFAVFYEGETCLGGGVIIR